MGLNRTEICALVLARIGRRGGDSFLLAQAYSELGLVQSRLETGGFLPWFMLSGEVTVATTTASVREVTLPADFIREHDDSKLCRYDSTAESPYVPLLKDEYDYLLTEYGAAGTGAPVAYALLGQEYVLFPTPDAAYTLKQNYFQKKSVLSGSVLTNAWTDHADDLLIAELGIVMARYAKNKEAKIEFESDKQLAIKRLTAFDIARSQTNRDARRGDIH